MTRFTLILILLLTASCSAHHSPIFWGWSEWDGPGVSGAGSAGTATFDFTTLPGVITAIDGAAVGQGYVKARLAPGKHRIEYADYPAEFGTHPAGLMEMDLIAGHVYEFRIKYCFWCKPRRCAVWIEDRTTGEVVWGTRPDWPSWWL